MVMDEPLDFEKEDPLVPTTRPAKRKKVIELDDLLVDFFATGKYELKASGVKSKHGPKGYNSDDEDKKVREKEIKFCKFVEEYEEQSKQIDAGDDVPQWGQRVFSCQKSPPILSATEVQNCRLLQSFSANEHLGFDLNIEQEGFLEGLLVDGWLLKLVLLHGSVEDSIASWALTKLLYSSNKKLQVAASDFWDSVLSLNEADKLLVNIGHFPCFSVLKSAVLSYGYVFDNHSKVCTSESVIADDGPPQNIIEWLKIISACCKISVFNIQKGAFYLLIC